MKDVELDNIHYDHFIRVQVPLYDPSVFFAPEIGEIIWRPAGEDARVRRAETLTMIENAKAAGVVRALPLNRVVRAWGKFAPRGNGGRSQGRGGRGKVCMGKRRAGLHT